MRRKPGPQRLRVIIAALREAGRATQEGGFMTRAQKSFRLELTKEQQAIILQKTGMEAKEVDLRDDALRIQTEPKRVGNQP